MPDSRIRVLTKSFPFCMKLWLFFIGVNRLIYNSFTLFNSKLLVAFGSRPRLARSVPSTQGQGECWTLLPFWRGRLLSGSALSNSAAALAWSCWSSSRFTPFCFSESRAELGCWRSASRSGGSSPQSGAL